MTHSIASDADKKKAIQSPKAYSHEHTLMKEEAQIDNTEQYLEDLKKGSSNILVNKSDLLVIRWLFDCDHCGIRRSSKTSSKLCGYWIRK